MQSVIRSIFLVVSLGYFTVVSAQLPPEIMADAYLLQVEQAIRGGDLDRARTVIQNIRNLQEQHDLDLSGEFHFRYAKAAASLDLPEQALVSIVKYLVMSGREGQHYVEALELMNRVRDRSSGDVVAIVSAHLSPNIMADAYLLQAEQAIRDGNLDQSRTVLQHILNLQEQHELDLPDEFHFRYAKAANSVDLPDQALESVVQYLAVSGREGQHYVEALELMNEVQRAASCKGWDTEEYFKTATLEEVTACLDAGVDLKARDDAGVTPLHRAAKNAEDLDVVKALLNAGADLEARDNGKRTPLHWAVLNKNSSVLAYLLKVGADPKARDKDDQTLLHYAVENNENLAVVEILLNTGADPKTKDKNKNTPLHYAAHKNKNSSVLAYLLKAGADPKARGNIDWTPLHHAAAFNENPDVAEVLLNAGADLEARDINKRTPLHYAALKNKNPSVVAYLIKVGADPKMQSEDKQTPLHMAAKSNNPDVIRLLLNVGADLKAKDKNNWTPLYYAAAFNENPDVVKILIELGADLKKRTDEKFRPLHYAAAYNKNPDVVKTLLNAGADLKATDKTFMAKDIYFMWTPLHMAARTNKNPNVLKVLLDAGADPNRQSIHGTPLHLAAVNAGNPDILKVLLDAGAELENRAKGFMDGETPLHNAAGYNNPDVIKFLLNIGADLKAMDKNKWTPLHYAAANNENPDVIKTLLNAGAPLNVQNKKGSTPLDLAVEKNENPDVARVLHSAGASQTQTASKSQQGDGLKTAIALLGGAAIGYAGKGSEESMDAARQFMEGVLNEQPAGDGNSNSAAIPSQTQGGHSQDSVQQALQNLENVCGEKYQSNIADNDHYRFYCMAAFNDYCALKRAQSSEAISKLRASLQQNCAVLKSVGADSKCSYCK